MSDVNKQPLPELASARWNSNTEANKFVAEDELPARLAGNQNQISNHVIRLAGSLMIANENRDARIIAIVGGFGGTHIGQSLARAAQQLGLGVVAFDIAEAVQGSRILRTLSWRLGGHRPLRLRAFSNKVVAACESARPKILIATGAASLTRTNLRKLRSMNISCINYSTDDPWNPNQRASWFLRALPEYKIVFTPRHANIQDFFKVGCRDVRYLPFGYDDFLFCPTAPAVDVVSLDVLFVGGADRDRVEFISSFMRVGPRVTVAGGYWDDIPAMRECSLGIKNPEAIKALTAAAKVNLCLVRRANRDDHVMRSLEIGAIGGCTIAEDTPGHRELFGPDGLSVRYFKTPKEAAALADRLIADPKERLRLSTAIRTRVAQGSHTYRDRLLTMVNAGESIGKAV